MSNLYTRDTAKRGMRQTLMMRPISQVLTGVSLVLIVNLLPEHDYGIYALFLSVLAFIGMILSLGISSMVQRFVPEYAKSGEYTRAKRVAITAMLLRAGSILLLAGGALFFLEPLTRMYDLQGYEHLYLPLLLVVLTHFQCRVLLQVLPGFMFQGYSLVGQIALSGGKVLGYLVMMQAGLGLSVVLWVDLAAYLLMLALLGTSYLRHVRPLQGGPATLGGTERKRIFRYAAFYNFNDVGVLGLGRDIDNLFLGAMTDPVAVGAYAFAGKFADIVLRVNPMQFFYTVIQPMFFTLDTSTQKEQINTLFGIMFKSSFLVLVPLWAGTAAGIEPLLRVVFSGKFLEFAWVVVAVMGITVATGIIGRPVGLVAQLRERADIVLYSKIFSFLNFALNLVLIPLFGLAGVVVATGVCTLAKDLFVWWFVRDIARPRHLGYFTLVTLGIWGSYIALGRGLQQLLGSDLLVLLALVLLGLPCALAYLRLALRTPEERAEIEALTGGNRRILKLMGMHR
ncbi:lipopolysaccharide biosynthesis protein [Pseudooceanicola sp. 200-1SW]|uniref:lipopolysaccharide biosynthesis protein n=1 Tax=Pseudooceanicola sp. 200-1SW TaxID=3425949 RepID=UPI003D7F388D